MATSGALLVMVAMAIVASLKKNRSWQYGEL
jgi:hypothetical protein